MRVKEWTRRRRFSRQRDWMKNAAWYWLRCPFENTWEGQSGGRYRDRCFRWRWHRGDHR